MANKDDRLPLMAMDNFEVKVVARGPEILRHTMELALCHYRTIVSFTEVQINTAQKALVFHWFYNGNQSQSKFPYAMELEELVPFTLGWLRAQNYGSEPDLDGHCTKGWYLFTSDLSAYDSKNPLIQAWHNVAFAVRPEWAEHHK